MKRILFLLVSLLTVQSLLATTYDRIVAGQIVQSTRRLPNIGVSTYGRFISAHRMRGWCIRRTQLPGPGMVATGWEIVVLGGNQSWRRPTGEATPAVLWVAAHTKDAQQLAMETDLQTILAPFNLPSPIPQNTLPTIIALADTWIEAGLNAEVRRQRQKLLLRATALWQKLGDAVYATHLGRQVVEGDYPE